MTRQIIQPAPLAAAVVIHIAAFACGADQSSSVASPNIVEVDALDGIVLGGVRLRDVSGETSLRVYPAEADYTDDMFPPVAGKVESDRRGVRFRPRYPFSVSVKYNLVWQAPEPAAARVIEFEIPNSEPDRDSARVIAVYPSGDVLPENQLKLYVHFATSMDTRDPYRWIQLVDAVTGEEVENVFHALRDGLWDANATRLTVVFDPGRVKRGLANHETWGPPIVRGHRYRLVVHRDWPDASGRTVNDEFIKEFTVTEPDRDKPDPVQWSVRVPTAGTTDPLLVSFGEPLDHALLQRAIGVQGPTGTLGGQADVLPGEEAWQFTPSSAWSPGSGILDVDCQLEDLAGNNVVRLFDHDHLNDTEATATPDDCAMKISFTIVAKPPS